MMEFTGSSVNFLIGFYQMWRGVLDSHIWRCVLDSHVWEGVLDFHMWRGVLDSPACGMCA